MPNQPKTLASTYRFDNQTRELMDALAEHFAEKSGLPCNRTDVIRLAVRQLAEREFGPKKKSKKSSESA